MFRTPILHYAAHHPHYSCSHFLLPLTLWICVSVGLRYGVFRDFHMVLGPNSSRLLTASSLFVETVRVRDRNGNGVLVYGFHQKPKLRRESNWTYSSYFVVRAYSQQGFSLWMNRGSTIRTRWETQISRLDHLQVIMIKGERRYQTLLADPRNSTLSFLLTEPLNRTEAEYTIEEDNMYYLGVINNSPRSIIMNMTLNVTSRMYDLTKATNMCSTLNGSCLLKLSNHTKYLVLTTPDNGNPDGWHVDLTFVARVVTYIAILGFFVVIFFLVLKYLGENESSNVFETPTWEVRETSVSETMPLWLHKPTRPAYGTTAEGDEENADAETGSSTSSEDLYDAKLCVICYDDQRNCFFVPCGHCATCYACAQRIMSDECKICPICRRTIHKVRRLYSS